MVSSCNPVTREARKYIPGILNYTWEETGSAFKDGHFKERKIQEDKKNASVLRTQLANCLLCKCDEPISDPNTHDKKPSTVGHTCNTGTGRQRQRDPRKLPAR